VKESADGDVAALRSRSIRRPGPERDRRAKVVTKILIESGLAGDVTETEKSGEESS